MFRILWDKSTGGVQLTNDVVSDAIGIAPRPVFYEELDLLKLNELGWKYPHCQAPLLWACNKQYFYKGEFVFEVKGANVYDDAIVYIQDGFQNLELQPVDVKTMVQKCDGLMFLAESEAIEFIRDKYIQYSSAKESVAKVRANQIDYEALVAKIEKREKKTMAIVKQDCDSFDIMPLDEAKESGKKVYQTTKIDLFLSSFSGGKDSQVVLDLCTRAIPPYAFKVAYSDTGYELPPSLSLYEEVKKYYNNKYPDLQFLMARNHEKVLNYWDKIGTPSDTHRWCCSVMKTAPLYRMLKIEGTNKQAKVLAFEGTRAEESTRRSGYERIGKGVKHNGVINARPIFNWNTTEVYLYLLKYNLPINQAYRLGKPRVGCLICPFSSEWDDMIVNKAYHKELNPFLTKIENWAKSREIPNLDEYIKGHKWKTRASGRFLVDDKSEVLFSQRNNTLIADVENPKQDVLKWLYILGDYTISTKETTITGNLKYNKDLYNFKIEYKGQDYKFTIYNITDAVFIGLVKRIIYKSTYCIQCEVCEVECPTGALSIYPNVGVDKNKCIHCLKCLNHHSKGCIVADSISMTQNTELKMTGISCYGTFGLREEWLQEFFLDPVEFWNQNSLGKKQIPSFKSWLRDAEIITPKQDLTKLGALLKQVYDQNMDWVWEIIWINLSYNSPLIKWFVQKVQPNAVYSKASMMNTYEEDFKEGLRTFEYSLQALNNLLTASPIGKTFNQRCELSKMETQRKGHDFVSDCAVAYSMYKYGEVNKLRSFRVSELYNLELGSGIYSEFGVSKSILEKSLKSLDTMSNRILIAELNTGLDHITLRDDLTSYDVLEIMSSL